VTSYAWLGKVKSMYTLSPLVAAPFEVFGVGVVCMNDLGNDYLLRCFNPVNNHLSIHQLLTFQKFHGSR
jgi:hypothetical protein